MLQPTQLNSDHHSLHFPIILNYSISNTSRG